MKIENSSNISEVDYFEEKAQLKVKFVSGGSYLYEAVPKKVYEAFINADSKGSYFARNIRNKYKSRKLNGLIS